MKLIRPRNVLLALLALIVPIQAGALSGGSNAPLSVSAALDYCGVGGDRIVCKIDVSWTGAEDADYFTSSVTLADGTISDMGTIGSGSGGGGSASLWVPYAGNGIYHVTVTAWGSDPNGKDQQVDTGQARFNPSDLKTADPGSKSGGGDPVAELKTAPGTGDQPPAGDEPPPPDEGQPAEPPPTDVPPTDPAPGADGTGTDGGVQCPDPAEPQDPAAPQIAGCPQLESPPAPESPAPSDQAAPTE